MVGSYFNTSTQESAQQSAPITAPRCLATHTTNTFTLTYKDTPGGAICEKCSATNVHTCPPSDITHNSITTQLHVL